eukprot:7792535-Prorocentrum_lima.AAC.1
MSWGNKKKQRPKDPPKQRRGMSLSAADWTALRRADGASGLPMWPVEQLPGSRLYSSSSQ